MRLLTIICCLSVTIAAAAADLYAASFTGPVMLQLPGMGQVPTKVFWRAGQGKWQPAEFDSQDGNLRFRLDPAKLGSGEVMLLVNPPAGLVLDDFVAPRLIGLKVDGKPQKLSGDIDLGNVTKLPREIVAAFSDRDNALEAGSWQATLEGRAWPSAIAATTPGPAQVRLTLQVPRMEYGQHEIVLIARDNSPQHNVGRVAIRLNYIDSGNVALASLGATVRVDSSFSGYESLVAINDGITALPGTSCGNDVTWASAEISTDHWAEVTLKRPTKISEVSVFWAAYTQVAHTAQQFEIQVPEGEGWRTVYRSPGAGESESRVTTARFEPVTTSKFRVFMPAGKGSVSRPNLLWLAEIKAR